MKFSVATRMRLPAALVFAETFAVGVFCAGCSTVAGRPILSLSMARGHSSYLSGVSFVSSWALWQESIHPISV